MHGLKRTSLESQKLRGDFAPEYIQLDFDVIKNRVYWHFFYGLDRITRAQKDENIVPCGVITRPMSMDRIAEQVTEHLKKNGYHMEERGVRL